MHIWLDRRPVSQSNNATLHPIQQINTHKHTHMVAWGCTVSTTAVWGCTHGVSMFLFSNETQLKSCSSSCNHSYLYTQWVGGAGLLLWAALQCCTQHCTAECSVHTSSDSAPLQLSGRMRTRLPSDLSIRVWLQRTPACTERGARLFWEWHCLNRLFWRGLWLPVCMFVCSQWLDAGWLLWQQVMLWLVSLLAC